MVDEADDRFHVAPSTIPGAGEGLFATVPLAEGDRLHVIGILIPSSSIADGCTRFADEYKIRVGSGLLIPVGWGAMVNHRNEGNVRKVIVGDEVFFEAVRPIAAGEEIAFRYHDYATSRFLPRR